MVETAIRTPVSRSRGIAGRQTRNLRIAWTQGIRRQAAAHGSHTTRKPTS